MIFISYTSWQDWIHRLRRQGRYVLTRNNSSLVAFAIGKKFDPTSNSAFATIASHIDSLCFKLKPVSRKSKSGIDMLGVAPYAEGGEGRSWDASYSLWWNRDLGIGGRVMVKSKDGIVRQQVMKTSTPSKINV
jgi:aminopeptidase I